MASMIELAAMVVSIFLGACGRLFHGGNQTLGSFYFKKHPDADKLPASRVIGVTVAAIGFATWLYVMGESLIYFLPAFVLAWLFTFMHGHQPWYDIGTSHSPARPTIHWIEWLQNKIWKQGQDAQPETFYSFSRDAFGFFLRMSYSFPGFLLIALIADPHWFSVFLALQSTLAFAALSVLWYALYNWLYPARLRYDGAFNPSEALTGASFLLVLYSQLHMQG